MSYEKDYYYEMSGGYEEDGRYDKEDCSCEEKKRWPEHDKKCMCEEQRHTHELEGSTKLAELDEDPHNHRYASVTGPAIRVPGGHIHKIFTRTDFFENHFHFIIRCTGRQIPVGNGKHVHFACGMTTLQDGHRHEFQVATLIEDPLSPTPEEKDY